jgi:hypothetical protein
MILQKIIVVSDLATVQLLFLPVVLVHVLVVPPLVTIRYSIARVAENAKHHFYHKTIK